MLYSDALALSAAVAYYKFYIFLGPFLARLRFGSI